MFGYPKGARDAGAGSRLPSVSETSVVPDDEVEEVDALPVTTEPGVATTGRRRSGGLVTRTPGQVAAQVAAVAVTGFAAGALVTAVARHAKGAKVRPRPRRELGGLEVLATRSFLVDVHVLGGRE